MTIPKDSLPPSHPLAEVFGYPVDNQSEEAKKARDNRLCPFNNRVPNCTKNSVENPLGVCSVFEGSRAVVTCPVRFRQSWQVAIDAAGFFFPEGAHWTSLTEVRLRDANGRSAGNIDVVLVSYDENGRVLDFGALEIQAVYISGNVSKPFEAYMANPEIGSSFVWNDSHTYPRPDYLSSSRKRLAPQLVSEGGILTSWDKKMAVALDDSFYANLPSLPEVPEDEAEMAWFIYGLRRDDDSGQFVLKRQDVVYTKFEMALTRLTVLQPGPMSRFMQVLQDKLNDKFEEDGTDVSLNSPWE